MVRSSHSLSLNIKTLSALSLSLSLSLSHISIQNVKRKFWLSFSLNWCMACASSIMIYKAGFRLEFTRWWNTLISFLSEKENHLALGVHNLWGDMLSSIATS
ncbi:hypothetical protein KP509_16G008300 [Ceratopteris richardii]|uniref:Uncharacterized protein n=1 Tax=Ceratopteris richardii TaxID=49495 RepID=A0A8T2T214_CERRI|nr:hypothetical protein KP509_16G008300 [Ceratopteris richardii]